MGGLDESWTVGKLAFNLYYLIPVFPPILCHLYKAFFFFSLFPPGCFKIQSSALVLSTDKSQTDKVALDAGLQRGMFIDIDGIIPHIF